MQDRAFCKEVVRWTELLFQDVKVSLEKFNKKNYPKQFAYLRDKYEKAACLIMQHSIEDGVGQDVLMEIAEAVIGQSQMLIRSKRWKFQQKNMQMDHELFVVLYLLPILRSFENAVTDQLSEVIAECWNHSFHTRIETGDYEQIVQGFGNTILGIRFGK